MYLEHFLESILKRRISLPFLEIISLHGFYTTILSFPRKRSKATREEQNKDTFINPTRLSSRRDSRYDAIYTRFVSFAILSSPWFFLLYPRFLQISLGGKKKNFPFQSARFTNFARNSKIQWINATPLDKHSEPLNFATIPAGNWCNECPAGKEGGVVAWNWRWKLPTTARSKLRRGPRTRLSLRSVSCFRVARNAIRGGSCATNDQYKGMGRRREEGGSREIEEAALSKRGAFDISRGSWLSCPSIGTEREREKWRKDARLRMMRAKKGKRE